MNDLTIAGIEALPCSVPMRRGVRQGLGQAVKPDTVIVRVTTAGGLTGYGESYNGRAPLAIAQTISTTLRDLFTGLDAGETTRVWEVFENRVLANHGTCVAHGYRALKLRLGDTLGRDLERGGWRNRSRPTVTANGGRPGGSPRCRWRRVRTATPATSSGG